MSKVKALSALLPEEENVPVQDGQTSGDLPERKITINSTSYDLFPTDEELIEFFKDAKTDPEITFERKIGDFIFFVKSASLCYYFCIKHLDKYAYSGYEYLNKSECFDSSKEEYQPFIELLRLRIDCALYSALKLVPEYRQQLIDVRENRIREDLSNIKTALSVSVLFSMK